MIARLAWRNILRQKRRTVLTLLTMTGGFVLSSLAIGWMSGSYSSIILFFTNGRTGQVQVHAEGYLADPTLYATVDGYLEIGALIDSVPGVRTWAPRIYAGALLAVRPRGAGASGVFANSAGASVVGIDPDLEETATSFSDRVVDGTMLATSPSDTLLSSTGTILLGKELAMTLEASPGDTLILLSQAVDGSEADRRYVVTGLVSTGNPQVDGRTCYVTLADAQTLLALQGRVHEIAVMSLSLDAVDGLTSRIAAVLGGRGLETDSWKTFAREFYNGMQADESSLKIMILIIVAVSAMGVLNTVLMTVLERRREFGVMKAMGTRPGLIVQMIVLEANIMGLAGVLLGSAVSTAGLLILSRHGMVLDPPIEYGGTIMSEMIASIGPECYWIPAVCVMLTTSLVSWIPAVRASRTEPARALRTV